MKPFCTGRPNYNVASVFTLDKLDYQSRAGPPTDCAVAENSTLLIHHPKSGPVFLW